MIPDIPGEIVRVDHALDHHPLIEVENYNAWCISDPVRRAKYLDERIEYWTAVDSEEIGEDPNIISQVIANLFAILRLSDAGDMRWLTKEA